jgi:hypothetical protein
MRHRPGPAEADEQAQLRALREQADTTGREVSETVAALATRLAETVSPRALARRKLADVRAAAWRAARGAADSRPRARLAATAAITTGLVVLAVAVVWQHRRHT